jgi:hypothetical protein
MPEIGDSRDSSSESKVLRGVPFVTRTPPDSIGLRRLGQALGKRGPSSFGFAADAAASPALPAFASGYCRAGSLPIAVTTLARLECRYRSVVRVVVWCIDAAMSFIGTPASASAVPCPCRAE